MVQAVKLLNRISSKINLFENNVDVVCLSIPYISLSSLTSCISIRERKILGTIPLCPPSPRGIVREIPPSSEGG